MNGDQNNDWRFQPTKLDPAYGGMDRGYNSGTGALAPAPLPMTGPTRTTGVSRITPSPSNTNWNSTFSQNTASPASGPSSPSGTDWQKMFGRSNSFTSPPQPSAVDGSRRSLGEGGQFQLSLSPANDRSGLNLSSPFQPRAADLAETVTSRDHQLYGAGPDLGFTY